TDPNYNGLDPSDVSVSNLETDTRDLEVTDLQVTSALHAGANATVQWNDADVGNVAVAGSFHDAITITNLTLNQVIASDTILYDESSLGPIAGGSSAVRQYSFTLPSGSLGSGQIQISVTTNSDNAILERNDDGTASSNNTASITVNSGTVIFWANPADIVYGTALSGTQLDATANVSGTFTY